MLTLVRKPAPIPSILLNQSTYTADGSVYRQFQFVWIGKHTFTFVVDLKFSLPFRTDFFTWIGIIDLILAEWVFHRGFFWVNSKTFFRAGICFMRRSSLRASLLVILELTPAISTGMRDFVYFEPLPELWATNRFSILLVIPQ